MKISHMMKFGIFFASMVFLSTLLCVLVLQKELPSWDHWDIFFEAPALFADGWGLEYLWASHNEHKIFIPKIFHAINLLYFSGGNGFLLWVIMISQVLILAGIVYVVFQDKILTPAAKIWLTIIAVILLFLGTQLENFTWPFQIQFMLCNLFGIFALIAYTKSIALQNPSIKYYIASCLLGILAALTSSQGLIILYAMVLLGILVKETGYRLIGTVLLTVLVPTVYVLDYVQPSHHPSLAIAFGDLLGLFAFVGVYLGAGLFRMPYDAGLCGGLGIIWACYTGITCWRKGWMREPLVMLGTGLQLYALGTALMTAVGRLGIGVEYALISRYSSISLLFWLGLILVLFFKYTQTPLPAMWERKKYRVLASILIVGTIVFATTWEVMRHIVRTLIENQAKAAFEMGVYDEDILKALYFEPEPILAIREFMLLNKLSIFSQDNTVLGKNLRVFSQDNMGSGCKIEHVQVKSLTPDPMQAEYIFRVDFNEKILVFPWQSYQVIFTDEHHLIQGYGLPKLAEPTWATPEMQTHWTGYIKMPLTQKQFEIYRVDMNTKSACYMSTYSLN